MVARKLAQICWRSALLWGDPMPERRSNAQKNHQQDQIIKTASWDISARLDEGPEEKEGGFHERLKQILENEKSASAFAKRAGISQSGLHRIESGGEPTLKTIVAIAKAANVSVQWLATGEEPTRAADNSLTPSAIHTHEPAVDKWLLSRAIDGIRRIYKRAGGQLSTINEVELGLEIHNRIVPLIDGQEGRHGALLLALDQLEKDLRAAAKTSSDDDKRTA